MTCTIATAPNGAGPWVWHHSARAQRATRRRVWIAILAVHQSATELPDHAEEQVLAQQALQDPNAFDRIYRTYVRDVRLFVYKRCGSIELADDITAATFEKALRGLRKFESKRGGMRAWLLVIAGNTLTDHYRRVAAERVRLSRAQRDPQVQGWVGINAIDCADDDSESHVQGQLTMIRAALERIHPRYREAIALRYLEGMSNEEAATATGRTRASMSVLTHRALRALAQQLESEVMS